MQLQQHEDELSRRDVHVLAVTFEDQERAEAYVRETRLPWPLLVDPSRSLYAAYGMHRGRWRDILGPAALGSYAKLMLQGRRPHRPTGDLQQLGGDVLIDPDGIVRLHHIGAGPADRPSVSSLLKACESFCP